MGDKISAQDNKQYKLNELSLAQLRVKYRKNSNWQLDCRGGTWRYQRRAINWTGKMVLYTSSTARGWEQRKVKGLVKPEDTKPKRSSVNPTNETVAQVIERFKKTKRFKAPRTFEEITRGVEKLSKELLKKVFTELCSDDFLDAYEYTKLYSPSHSPLQGKRSIKLLKNIYSSMSKSGLNIVDQELTTLMNDECKTYRIEVMPRVKQEIDYAHVSKIMNGVRGLDEEIIYLLEGFCGCRISEALGMPYKNLDLKRKIVVVDQQVYQISKKYIEGHNKSAQPRLGITRTLKTEASRREIPMPSRVERWALAHQHLAPDDLVYTTQTGGICSVSNWLSRHHWPLMNRFEFGGLFIAKTHSLRKYYISSLKRNKVDDATIANWAGNSIEVTSKHYVKIILDETVEEINPEDDLNAYEARVRQQKIVQFNESCQPQKDWRRNAVVSNRQSS